MNFPNKHSMRNTVRNVCNTMFVVTVTNGSLVICLEIIDLFKGCAQNARFSMSVCVSCAGCLLLLSSKRCMTCYLNLDYSGYQNNLCRCQKTSPPKYLIPTNFLTYLISRIFGTWISRALIFANAVKIKRKSVLCLCFYFRKSWIEGTCHKSIKLYISNKSKQDNYYCKLITALYIPYDVKYMK